MWRMDQRKTKRKTTATQKRVAVVEMFTPALRQTYRADVSYKLLLRRQKSTMGS